MTLGLDGDTLTVTQDVDDGMFTMTGTGKEE